MLAKMVGIFFTMMWLAAWTSLFLLKLVPVFVVFASTETCLPESHSPVLLLQVILHQTARRPRIGPFLLFAPRIPIVALIDMFSPLNWVATAAITYLWTVVKALGCDEPTAVYTSAQAMARIHALLEEYMAPLMSVNGEPDREEIFRQADEAGIKGWIWIDMDNAPPLESGTSVDS